MVDIITFTSSKVPKSGIHYPDVQYPESDGQPVGETEYHINAILYLFQALRYFFRRFDQIYVAADMLFYYEEGNPAAYKVPDVFVVKGVAKQPPRRTYKLWQEGAAPCTVFEITSRSTWLDDLGAKRGLYEKIGAPEYFLFDPLDEYLSPRLQGFRLVDNYYQPMPLAADGTLISQQLGLILRPTGSLLRLVDPSTGQFLPTLDEAAEHAQAEAERAQAEAQRAQAEAERADSAEAKLARLSAELEQLKKQIGQD